ncbi:MAG: HEAT repeat domain-containing protein [Dehalococcoidia bacterium]
MRWFVPGGVLLLGALLTLGGRFVFGPREEVSARADRLRNEPNATPASQAPQLVGRPAAQPGASVVGAGGAEAHAAPPGAVGRPADLVLVEATTDRDTYSLGEPVRIRRTFENPSDRPIHMDAAAWRHKAHAEVVLATGRGAGIREPSTHGVPEVTIAPGKQVVNELVVELPAPGTWTVEIPPEYQIRGSGRTCFRLQVTVVDRIDEPALAAKFERLARAIEKEDPSCPTCWSDAHKDLATLGAAAVPHLRRWLREAEVAHLRAVAAKILGPQVRAGALGRDELLAGLTDPEASVRTMCVAALAGTVGRDVVDALLLRLRDADRWVRFEAIRSVAQSDDARVVPALVESLEDAEAFVAQRAAEALADKGSAAGIRVLVEALVADPVLTAFSVVDALEKLAGVSFGKAEMPLVHSNVEATEEAVRANETVARRWREWWESEGRRRFGD